MLEIIATTHRRELATRMTTARFREEYEAARRLAKLERSVAVTLARLGLRPAGSAV